MSTLRVELTVSFEVPASTCGKCRKVEANEVVPPVVVERWPRHATSENMFEVKDLPKGWSTYSLPGSGSTAKLCGECGPAVRSAFAAVVNRLGIGVELPAIIVWACGVCGGGAHSGLECIMPGPPICEGCRAAGKTAADVVSIQDGQPADGADFVPAIVVTGR